METKLLLLIIALPLLSVAVVAVILILVMRSQKNVAGSSLSDLAAELGAQVRDNSLFGKIDGTPFRLDIIYPTKAPGVVSITVPWDGSYRATAWKMGFVDRLGRKFGVTQEIRSNDPVFDAAVYTESDDPGDLCKRLYLSGFRRALQSLVQGQAWRVEFAPGAVTYKARARGTLKKFFDVILGQDPKRVVADLAGLSASPAREESAQALPSHTGSIFEKKATIQQVLTTTLMVIFIIAAITVFVVGAVCYEPVSGMELFFSAAPRALIWTAIICVGLLLITHVMVRQKRGAAALFAAALFAYPPIVFFGSVGAFMTLNGALDQGPAQTHIAVVADKYRKMQKGGPAYYLYVQSWRTNESTVKFRVHPNLYRDIRIGGSVAVQTRPGHWDVEWLTEEPYAP